MTSVNRLIVHFPEKQVMEIPPGYAPGLSVTIILLSEHSGMAPSRRICSRCTIFCLHNNVHERVLVVRFVIRFDQYVSLLMVNSRGSNVMSLNKSILDRITVLRGDITKETTGAIVNAANPGLLGGGGVDGAIHRAAGPCLLDECRTLGGCRPGEARITGGYNLAARYVIHTPGPVYTNGKKGEAEILRGSYWNSLGLAEAHGIASLSFPAISTGVYGYPKKEACSIAIDTVCEYMEQRGYHPQVHFVLFDEENFLLYRDYLQSLRNRHDEA